MHAQFIAIDTGAGHERIQAGLNAELFLRQLLRFTRLLQMTLEDQPKVPLRIQKAHSQKRIYEIRNFRSL